MSDPKTATPQPRNASPTKESPKMLVKMVVQTAVFLVAMLVLLLVAGDDWGWRQAYVLMGEVGALSLAISLWLWRHDPELLKARMTSPFAKGQRPRDLAIIAVTALLYIAWHVLMGVDARRYLWTEAPLWAQILGALLVGAGMTLAWETFRSNSFAAPQVRVQGERGQRVVDTGPYRYVRHPMYAGAALYFLGAPLVLGSLWGLAGSAVLILALGVRAVGEEAVLRADLPGYADYMQATPWRLVPGVW